MSDSKILQKLAAKEMTRKEFLHFMAFGFMALFGVYGLYKELATHAATPTLSLEPESGTLAGTAKVVTDTTASGGKAVSFNAATGFTRPTGVGIYAIENLGVTNNLQQALDKVATLAAASDGSRTLTLPNGTYTAASFNGGASDHIGFLAPRGVGLVGSGPGTIIEVATDGILPAQITMATSTNNVLNTLRFQSSTVPIRVAQFTVRGNNQKGYNYNNLNFAGIASGSIVEDILVYGAVGSLNSPPGETSQIGINSCNGVTFRRVEADGRRPGSSTRYGALGFGVNNSTNLSFYDCYTHHMGFSHGISFWQSNTIKTWNLRSEYNGTGAVNGGGGGSSGDGINHEKSSNCIHYAPRLGNNSLTEIRYYAWPTSQPSSTSGDTFGHELHDVVITDGGAFNIKIEKGQRNTNGEITLFNCPTPVYQLFNLV